MKKILIAVAATFCAAAYASITTQPIDGGGTALVVTGTAYTQEEVDALNNNDVTELWKTGSATLVSEGIGSFTGIIRVKGGIMQVAAQAGLGTTDGATYVESGATLEQTSVSPSLAEPMFLEGNGVGGMGAYYASDNTKSKSPGLSGAPVTLTGDALLVGRQQWYLKPSDFDMGGHLLTLSNINHQCVFNPSKITNAGHILVVQGTIWLNNGADMTAGPEHILTLTNSVSISLYGYKTQGANWTIRYCSTGVSGNGFYISATSTANPSRWYGPVEIPSGYSLYANLASSSSDYAGQQFWGPLFGEGGIKVASGNALESVKLYGTNTYTGQTSIPGNGNLWFMHRKAMPSVNPAKYDVSGTGKMYLPLREDGSAETFVGWTSADMKEFYEGFGAITSSEGAHPFLARIEAGETFTYPYDFNAALHSYYCQQRYVGGGTVKITGDCIGRPRLRLAADADDGTTIEIDGSGEGRHNEYGRIDFYDGRFLLKNMDWFTSTNETTGTFLPVNVCTHGTSPKSRVTFGPGAVMRQIVRRATETFSHIYDFGTCGVLEFLDGCVFTNRLVAASGKDQSAAIYHRGGEVYLTNGGGNDGYLGYSGYCFYEKTGGTLAIRGWTRLGRGAAGAGIFHGKGDWKMDETSLAFGAGGTGVLYQTSGKLSALGNGGGALSICNANYAAASGGQGVITVKGADACVYVKNDMFYMADCSKSKSFVNIMDGGTMQMAQLRKQGLKTFRTGNDITEAYAYVNFNGGVLKSTGKNANLFGADAQAPDRVTVFSGGAILDSDTYTVTNNIALQAPTGKGIVSIALPEGFDETGYVGPPVVTIVGDGTGATAVCEFDSTNQTVTGITVTSPGWNYTTATVTLSRGGKTAVTACTATLADNATTGGLTKRGTGTIVLSEANTYGGATRIEAGTLVAANAAALPSGSEIVLAGGTLAVGSGVSAPGELTVDPSGYGTAEGRPGRWTLMTVEDGTLSEPVVHGLPSGWMTQCAGNALVLRRVRGTMVSVR